METVIIAWVVLTATTDIDGIKKKVEIDWLPDPKVCQEVRIEHAGLVRWLGAIITSYSFNGMECKNLPRNLYP